MDNSIRQRLLLVSGSHRHTLNDARKVEGIMQEKAIPLRHQLKVLNSNFTNGLMSIIHLLPKSVYSRIVQAIKTKKSEQATLGTELGKETVKLLLYVMD